MSVIVANRTGEIDSAYHTLVKHIHSPIPIVMISWSENFIFNDDLLNIKDYVLCCFCEYGWNATLTESHIWGINSEKFPRYYNKDWVTFDKWVRENPPKLLLKRELLKKDVSEKVQPIEYPCLVDMPEMQTKDQFYERPLSVFHYWGRSNEGRVKAHADFWLISSENGCSVCDSLTYLPFFLQEESNKNKWVTINIPHYVRTDISNLMHINELSKLSLSMSGAGKKCFRHGESPSNSVMVMEENDLAWSFPWLDGINCLQYKDDPVERIDDALRFYTYDVLHTIYKSGVENCKKYKLENYIPYLEKLINAAIK